MKAISFFISLLFLSINFAHANITCDSSNRYVASFENVTFEVPNCLGLSIEEGNNVYRYKNGNYKSFIMITKDKVSSQQIYNNLKQIGSKLTYLNRELILVNNIKVTLVSFKSSFDEAIGYEVKTYIFDDLGISFTTHETKEDHLTFFNVVKSVVINK